MTFFIYTFNLINNFFHFMCLIAVYAHVRRKSNRSVRFHSNMTVLENATFELCQPNCHFLNTDAL
jgi:hypothetical protein